MFATPKLVSLVSKGCEVIRVPKAQFLALADEQTLERLQGLVRAYPKDAELCRTFLQQNKWDCFKHELLEAMIGDIQSASAFENNLRNSKRMDYLRKSAEEFCSNRGPEKPLYYKRYASPKETTINQGKSAKGESFKGAF